MEPKQKTGSMSREHIVGGEFGERLGRKEFKTEIAALRRDWLEKQGIDISDMKFHELKQVIRWFYSENETIIKERLAAKGISRDGELSALVKKKLDFKKPLTFLIIIPSGSNKHRSLSRTIIRWCRKI